jgi:holo-[acyl-carrier protein] synthase
VVTAASRAVRLPAAPGSLNRDDLLRDLLRGCPPELVYSRAEMRLCGARPGPTGWGGRLAAKLAVADLFDVDAEAALDARRDVGLRFLEILPAPCVPCPDGAGCTRPHPPDVRFGEGFGITRREDESVKVSISHTTELAVALAVRVTEGAQP